jgi:hypothetical protein
VRVAELAARSFQGWRATALAVVAAALVAGPLRASAAYAREMSEPLTRDILLDWVASSVPRRSRIVSSVPLLGLDSGRHEVLALPRIRPENRAQVLEADLVLSTAADAGEAVAGLEPLLSITPDSKYQGRTTITAWAVPAPLRPALGRLGLESRWLSASDRAEDLPQACDGRTDTLWRTAGPQERGDWVAVSLPEPVRVARLELVLGDEPRFAARQLRLEVTDDGETWREATVLPGRAPVEQQPPGGEYSQVLLLSPPQRVRALRLVQTGLGWRRRWGIAELRAWAAER